MTVNNNKSYLSYLNRLIYEGNNSYHHCIGKKTINADYTALTEEIGTYSKLPKFNVGYRVRITKYTNIFSKGYTDNLPREIFVTDSILKTNT